MADSYIEDGRSHRERMLAGDHYLADDLVLNQERARAAHLTRLFNNQTDEVQQTRILQELLGAFGNHSVIRPPFQCDYGYQTYIGDRTFANWGLIALDVGVLRLAMMCK